MFSRFALRTRIAIVAIPTALLALLCTLFLAIDAYIALDKMQEKADELAERSLARAGMASDFRGALLKSSVTLRDITLANSDAERSKFVERRTKLVAEMTELLKELKKSPTAGQEEIFETLDKTMVEFGAAVETFDSLWKGKIGANEEPSSELRRVLSEGIWNLAVPIRDRVEDAIMKLRATERTSQQAIAKEADVLHGRMSSRLIVVGALSVIFSLISAITIVGYMSHISKRLATITRALSRSFGAVENTSHAIAKSSTHLASSTTEEASSIAETAAAMEQMTATISKTVQNVATTLEVAEEGQHEAQRGREVVGKMLGAMNEIQAANAKLETMVKLIEEIKDKTRVINDIVFETRLLSFNASIEAARAGARGRGFAVVAEEVGNLAVVSGKAADEIRVLLESSTSQVNDIVRGTQERVDLGRARAEECEKAFGGMGESLSRVCQFVRGISSAAQEQDSGVKQINRAMAQLDAVTQTNASEAEGLNGQAGILSDESIVMAETVKQLFVTVLGRDDDGDSVGEGAEREATRRTSSTRSSGNGRPKRAPRSGRDSHSSPHSNQRAGHGHSERGGESQLAANDTHSGPHENTSLDVPLRDDQNWRAS
jgi:methyl-accepting chemotaxis protein